MSSEIAILEPPTAHATLVVLPPFSRNSHEHSRGQFRLQQPKNVHVPN